MSGDVNDYLARLEQQLGQRGIQDPRMLAEAREHLVDAVEDGRQRGLSLEDAEREALDRFGAPEIVAAHILQERDRMSSGFASVAGLMWRRKWWIGVPTLIAAIVTGFTAYNFLPDRYRAQAVIFVQPPRVTAGYATVSLDRDRLSEITSTVLNYTRLEAMIKELDLYPNERQKGRLSEAIERMRDDIHVVSSPNIIRLSYASPDPQTAMKVTEALATLFIESNLAQRQSEVVSTSDFIASQIETVREQIIAQEKMLATLRAESGGQPLSQAYLIPYETLKETYKALLVKQQQAALAANVERRQVGEQYRLLETARLPEQPDGPNRAGIVALGSLFGLLVGLALVALRRSTNAGPPALAQA